MVALELWKFILAIISAGGGGAFIAWLIFSLLGRNLIQSVFDKQLESYKAKQNQELEHYKSQLNAIFNKITKIHEKEYEVLPSLWCKLQNSLGLTANVTALFKEYPKMRSKNIDEVTEICVSFDYSKSQIDKVVKSPEDERNNIFRDILESKKIDAAMKSILEFHNYLLLNKIFLDTDLFIAFSNLDKKLRDIIDDYRYGKYDKERELVRKAIKDFRNLPEDDIYRIEKLIQKRLHYIKI